MVCKNPISEQDISTKNYQTKNPIQNHCAQYDPVRNGRQSPDQWLDPPLLRLTFSEVWTFSKDKNLYRNRAKLRLEVDCNFRICIQIYEAAITCKVNMTMAAETKC